jgi:hypothetical protein
MSLERSIHRALRELPPRRAPATLQERVFAELERRAALPWWRKSFLQWPIAARVVFLFASFFFIKGALDVISWMLTSVQPAATRVEGIVHALGVVGEALTRLFQLVPSQWFQAAVLFGAAVYVVFFALGATAYRMLLAPSRR